MEIAVRLSPKQLDHVAPVLEEIIHEIVEERQKGTRCMALCLIHCPEVISEDKQVMAR